ncbi:hypothetical protein DHW03_15700 [Pedobacter yonginense]|uniref:Uncharacterized protein n=2 Tax=Pedobacter yonginense TaxID=651869 RepID=A0A317EJD6_9SPHI|nr:hypothetical protein DHW03_15700 [Pedobacter yonginense]
MQSICFLNIKEKSFFLLGLLTLVICKYPSAHLISFLPNEIIMRKLKIEKMQPEKLVEMLNKKGVKMSITHAKEVLDLLYVLAILEVEQVLKT